MVTRCFLVFFFSVTILSSFLHPFLPPLCWLVPPLERLLSVHFQSPWRSGCSPSSISCVGSETRFWSAALLNKAHSRFRCVCAWSGSGWNETPSPAQVFGNESIFDVLCACLSRSRLLLGYKVTNLIVCKAKSDMKWKLASRWELIITHFNHYLCLVVRIIIVI